MVKMTPSFLTVSVGSPTTQIFWKPWRIIPKRVVKIPFCLVMLRSLGFRLVRFWLETFQRRQRVNKRWKSEKEGRWMTIAATMRWSAFFRLENSFSNAALVPPQLLCKAILHVVFYPCVCPALTSLFQLSFTLAKKERKEKWPSWQCPRFDFFFHDFLESAATVTRLPPKEKELRFTSEVRPELRARVFCLRSVVLHSFHV